ncbi:MAG TPA: hypothetical protein VGM78_02465 [Ilumatobacteraceae bacterium]
MALRGANRIGAAVRVCSLLAVAALVGVSCSSSSSNSAPPATAAATTSTLPITAVPSTTAVATTVPPTEAPTTTVAPPPTGPPPTEAPTTTAAPTTTLPPVDPLLLRVGGIGGFDDGSVQLSVLSVISLKLGKPTSSESVAFPTADGASFDNADNSITYTHPVGQRVCWSEFCLYFGGTDGPSLVLTGWTYRTTGDSSVVAPKVHMQNADGITIGSKWSDFPNAMTAQAGACATHGSGATTDGTRLSLQGGFATSDTTGATQPVLPDPSLVTVRGMAAGDVFVDPNSGC